MRFISRGGNRFSFPLALAFSLAGPCVAVATPTASSVISEAPDGVDFQYTLVLQDTSSLPATSANAIGTYWFAWIPGQDYLNTSPLSVTSPAGWQEAITHGGSTDGYAIQWKASTAGADFSAGNSLTGFGFVSADGPSSVFGNTPYYPSTSTLTGVVYEGTPFSDSGNTFIASVPEPTGIALTGIAALSLLIQRRRGRTPEEHCLTTIRCEAKREGGPRKN